MGRLHDEEIQRMRSAFRLFFLRSSPLRAPHNRGRFPSYRLRITFEQHQPPKHEPRRGPGRRCNPECRYRLGVS